MELYEVIVGLIVCLILIGGTSVYLGAPAAEKGAVSSSGLISYGGIDLFSDASLSAGISHVDWGVLEPGDSSDVSIYVLNRNEEPIFLGMLPENWSPPAAQQFLDLSWSYSGAALGSNEFTEIILTLTVSGEISGIDAFSFDVSVGSI